MLRAIEGDRRNDKRVCLVGVEFTPTGDHVCDRLQPRSLVRARTYLVGEIQRTRFDCRR